MTLFLTTARVGYQGTRDQLVLNTTAKSGAGLGKVFAPTWELVMASKRGEIQWQQYVDQYLDLMRKRYQKYATEFNSAVELGVEKGGLVLLCYCPDTSLTTRHCHRYLLADILAKVAFKEGYTAYLLGEVKSGH